MLLLSAPPVPVAGAEHSLVVATVWLVVVTGLLALATAGIAILALLAKNQVLEQLEQARNEQLHVRARATLEAIAAWRTVSEPLFVELVDKYGSSRPMEKVVEEERDQAFNRLVRRILERVEQLAL